MRFVVKTCACGRGFTASEWAELARVGVHREGEGHPDLEMRSCPCGSTITLPVESAAEPQVGHTQRTSLTVTAPARPRRDDTRRYCLPCSGKGPRLVERVAPTLARVRAKASERTKVRRRKGYRWKPKTKDYYDVGQLGIGHRLPDRVFGYDVRVRVTKGPGPVRIEAAPGEPNYGVVTFRKGAWADRFDGQAQEHVAEARVTLLKRGCRDNNEFARSYIRDLVHSTLGVRPRLKSLSGAAVEVASLLRSKAAIALLGHGHEDRRIAPP